MPDERVVACPHDRLHCNKGSPQENCPTLFHRNRRKDTSNVPSGADLVAFRMEVQMVQVSPAEPERRAFRAVSLLASEAVTRALAEAERQLDCRDQLQKVQTSQGQQN